MPDAAIGCPICGSYQHLPAFCPFRAVRAPEDDGRDPDDAADLPGDDRAAADAYERWLDYCHRDRDFP